MSPVYVIYLKNNDKKELNLTESTSNMTKKQFKHQIKMFYCGWW